MIRNLKALGLALVAVFAMSAMTAAGAHAEKTGEFWAETGTVKIDSTADSGHQKFVTGGKTVTCTVVGGHAAYSGVSAEQTATSVSYSTCHTTALGLSFPTTVTQETGCHYTFTAGTYTVAGNGSSDGSVHICGSTIDIYNSSGGHTEANMRCQIHVPAQTVSGVKFINATGPNGKMAVTIEANELNVTNTTITDFNTLGCNTHETVTSKYTGSIWAEGTDGAGGATDTTVTGT